jgi:ssDNA-binding Zn-finger/Zn-ribbon topoisomerase 1
MFSSNLLTNEIIRKIDCPGCYDHAEVKLNNNSSDRSCVMIKKYMDLFAERIKNMKVHEDDVWVVTFPKCGTTWTQEMIWLINNDLDYKTAYDVNLNVRFPFLE